MMNESTSERSELQRLVELEYDRTSKFIEGVASQGSTVRGWAVTVWVALFGVAFSQRLWPAALLALAAIVVFVLLDAYLTALYEQALSRARQLERIVGLQYSFLARGADDPSLEEQAFVALAAHKYGLYSGLRTVHFQDLMKMRKNMFLRIVYPTMGLLAIASSVVVNLLPPPAKT